MLWDSFFTCVLLKSHPKFVFLTLMKMVWGSFAVFAFSCKEKKNTNEMKCAELGEMLSTLFKGKRNILYVSKSVSKY